MNMVDRTTPAKYKLSPYRVEAGVPRDRGTIVATNFWDEMCGTCTGHAHLYPHTPTRGQYQALIYNTKKRLEKAEDIIKSVEDNYATQTSFNDTGRKWQDQRESWFTKEEVELMKMYLDCTNAMWDEVNDNYGLERGVLSFEGELIHCDSVLTELVREVQKRKMLDKHRAEWEKNVLSHCIHCTSDQRYKHDSREKVTSVLCTCEEGCDIPKTSVCMKQRRLKLY